MYEFYRERNALQHGDNAYLPFFLQGDTFQTCEEDTPQKLT